MSNKVKNEHYVPRRYLAHFADNNKHFNIFDKAKNQKRPGSIEDYACERYFYDVDFEALKQEKLKEDPDFVFDPEIERAIQELEPQFLENWFGRNVETWLFEPIDRIISSYVMCNPEKLAAIEAISDDDKDYLSLYMAVQLVRSKEFRKYIVEMEEKVPVLLMKKVALQKHDDDLLTFLNSINRLKLKNKNHEKLLHSLFLMDEELITHMAEVFRNKLWIVGYNRTNVKFFTSDNPVVKHGNGRYNGFNSRGVEIVFPITPYLILILGDMQEYGRAIVFDKHFVEVDDKAVSLYNSLQVIGSYRYIFSIDDSFPEVSEVMKKNPQLKDIDRDKMLMG